MAEEPCEPPAGYARSTVSAPLDGESVKVSINDLELAVFCVRGKLYAIDATCPHQGAALIEGDIEDLPGCGPCVSCPQHGWLFDLRNGYCEDIMDYGVMAYDALRLSDGALCIATAPNAQPPIEE